MRLLTMPRWMLTLGLCFPLLAQYPGQYPPGQYPPGQYPPGQYPGGVGMPRIPMPGRKKTSGKAPAQSQSLPSYTGVLVKFEPKSLVMRLEDSRLMTYKFADSTKFLRNEKEISSSALKPGDELEITASQDEDGYFFAATVTVTKPAKAASMETGESKEAEAAEADVRRPTVLVHNDSKPDKDDEAPPVMRRGVPTKKSKPQEPAEEPIPEVHRPTFPNTVNTLPRPADPAPKAQVPQAAEAGPTPIDKAREAASNFTETLPNYIVQQFTTRYYGSGKPIQWQAQDVVSAEVVYENGKEDYRKLAINGKATKKKMEELPGSWSTGEFGTVLVDLLSPSTAANFRYRHAESISHRSALMYDYDVDREHSHWRIQVGGQTILPSYKGSVWIDKETSRVLRIEMRATKIPEEFPNDTVETATDYEFIRLGDAHMYLLPVHSESLSCIRGTDTCTRNEIDFRNYKKYSGESIIIFDK